MVPPAFNGRDRCDGRTEAADEGVGVVGAGEGRVRCRKPPVSGELAMAVTELGLREGDVRGQSIVQKGKL